MADTTAAVGVLLGRLRAGRPDARAELLARAYDRLDRLTALHVEGFYADLRRDAVGPFAVRAAADLLGGALNHAVRLKLIPANPAAAVPKPRTPKREMRCLDEAQARAVLDAGRGAAVSQRLGHANPTMTLRVYAHCMPADNARLADGLNAAFAAPAGG